MSDWTEAELNRLFRYGLALSGDRDTAYDLLQSALLRWLEAPVREVDDRLRYVLRIIRNLYFDRLRRDRRVQWVPLEDSEPVDLDLAPLEQTLADTDEVAWLLADLSDAERELLYLWAVEGYTVDEISAHAQVPRGTLLARLHRMRRRIQSRRQDGLRESGS